MKDWDEIVRGNRATEERLADRGICVEMLPVESRKKIRSLISQLADIKISHELIETKISCARQIKDVAYAYRDRGLPMEIPFEYPEDLCFHPSHSIHKVREELGDEYNRVMDEIMKIAWTR
jgi:hypothetical protein